MTAPDNWRPADGLELEPNALIAVREQHRSVALTAGPGSGKTELLAQRADFLLRTNSCPYPQRILAISFKVDASRNLKERVRRRCGPLAHRFDSHTFHGFAKRLIDRFRPVLSGQNELDADYTIGGQRVMRSQITFADLVPLAVEVLSQSDLALNAVRQTYSHVFLDEFQDCTEQQFELVRSAFLGTQASITAVGDTKQRIMGWAGALEGIMETFAEEFNARPLNLYQNFRSLPRVRRVQNNMVKVIEPTAAVLDSRIDGDEGEVEIRAFKDGAEEAVEIAALVQTWINEGTAPSEIGILAAKQVEHYCEMLMQELSRLQIPIRNEQELQDISAEPVAQLVVDFLLVICADGKPNAYDRFMRFISSATEDEETQSYWRTLIDARRREVRSGAGFSLESVQGLVAELLKEIGAAQIASLSADYENGSYLNERVSATLRRIEELWDDSGEIVSALERFSEDRAVRLMTVHKSKGLEFEYVVFLGIERETFWGKADDERAVFFVGISRAKRHLVLTHTTTRPKPSGHVKKWHTQRTPHAEFLSCLDEV